MAISKRGMRKIVVDDDVYYWRSRGDDYWFTTDVNLGVAIVTADGLEHGKRGRWIRFAPRRRGPYDQIGWWDDLEIRVMPRHIERAIRIAKRRRDPGDIVLTRDETREVLDRELRTVEVEVRGLAALLVPSAIDPAPLVAALLSIGCRGADPALCDDWVASNADELSRARLALQQLVAGTPRSFAPLACERRSAIEFLRVMCERVGYDHGLDCTAIDGELRGRTAMVLPWGIPEHHWWWTQL